MMDKRMSPDEVASQLRSGMTLGIGGWGSRRKPMALVRAILRSDLTDLTVVSFGGPDVGLLVAAGRIRHLVTAFVTLDSVPLEPLFRAARESSALGSGAPGSGAPGSGAPGSGGHESSALGSAARESTALERLTEYDEGMLLQGLSAAAQRLPFLPIRAGLGSDVLRINPGLRTVTSPYDDGEELVAMPALRMDAALLHLNRADRSGNGQFLGPDPYLDDLFAAAADAVYLSCEQLVDTADLQKEGGPSSLLIPRHEVTGVVETPNGAHFTSCAPDYDRDERFQRAYVQAAADPAAWAAFQERFLAGDESAYQAAVTAFRSEAGQ
ncbi:CoA transferase subunit A [Streptacidiphilus sp. PAMC 29251]